jgi:nicotinamide-nucleotide amidase
MTDIPALVEQLAERLQAHRQWLAVAESCTGGWLAKCLTDRAGSSAWFERGFVTYSNDAKQELLGVPAEVLEQHGAVSADTVLAMAEGALAHSHADVAVAISGIAGPGGAVPGKPVGTVCFGFATREQRRQIMTVHFEGDRAQVREQSVVFALRQLLRLLTHA